ncbi:hypothetical protein [Sphingobium sp. IP1]|uniref:hypothetical protein n=1 Tax=Sphingobium sp. IP1 TaxID=2021637 RepID=UPI00117AB288|nr:hypothetical protein [Sphingobium sp. IP1]
MSNAKRALIGCGLVAGAVACFLLGMLVSQRAEQGQELLHPPAASKPSSSPAGRRVYSPGIADDPYVAQQWRQSVEILERRCREAREFCTEARAARRQFRDRE